VTGKPDFEAEPESGEMTMEAPASRPEPDGSFLFDHDVRQHQARPGVSVQGAHAHKPPEHMRPAPVAPAE
jgi:hypothetical protein